MSRKGRATRRKISPDSLYNSSLIQRFINRLMYSGKKSIAQGLVYKAFEAIKQKTNQDPLEVFKKAVKNATPLVKVKARRIGGSTYQVPIEVGQFEGESIGSRWLIKFARSRNGRSMVDKLASEIIDASNQQGSSVKKKEDTHKMADANKAFAHYRF